MDSDTVPTTRAPAELVALRHDRLRRTAPAVQHEVNNALMVLSSNLELLGRHAVEGAPRRQLDRALEAMRRLEATVRGYLDAARREAEDPAAVAPDAAVRQALPLLRVVLGNRFAVDLEGPEKGLPAVQLDRGRLDLALLCLVRDAAGRMAHGARILVRAEDRGTEVALALDLPEGAAPEGDAARMLAEAAEVTGGRFARLPAGIVLSWPRAG
ncbi:histidine kinase dimerization/phospho-acceptor domain-containing protein [Falsiroseomonas sp. HW251]|uniref:histidine kinase dimerization/phospho-acceptor domain-containing protein n=1 Tax=Falsiroseomonas sp. HW251 TaxID=3390998 RepID=UPI003D320CAC